MSGSVDSDEAKTVCANVFFTDPPKLFFGITKKPGLEGDRFAGPSEASLAPALGTLATGALKSYISTQLLAAGARENRSTHKPCQKLTNRIYNWLGLKQFIYSSYFFLYQSL